MPARIDVGRKPSPDFFASCMIADMAETWKRAKAEVLAKYPSDEETLKSYEVRKALKDKEEEVLKQHRNYPTLQRLRETWDPVTQTHRR